MRKNTRTILLLALLVLSLIGCRRGAESGTLVIVIEATPRGFDPRFSTVNPYSARLMQLIYDTLVVKNERFEFVGSLAERFTESADQKTFTFHLRPGVTFHDGKLLTSADVKYTFDTLLSPDLKSPIRGTIDKLTKIETPDPLTVIFHASQPFYTFIGNLPAIGIIPKGAGTEIINAPIGSGPFQLVAYKEGESVRLIANPNYWGGAPTIARLHVKVVADSTTRQAELMSGSVDLAYNAQFDPETVRAMSGRRDLQVVIENGANVDYVGLNLSSSSRLANQKLRQAIAYALNRDVIIQSLLRNQARRAEAIMPPEHWAYAPEVTTYHHDVARAKQLLDEAGLPDPDGEGGQPRLELNLFTTTTPISRNIGAIMQNQLREVGIQLNLQSLELATLLDKVNKAQFDLYYLRALGFNQGTDVFQFVYHSRFQNAEFNETVAKLRAANEAAQMAPLFDRLRAILDAREYCANEEVSRLAEQAAGMSASANASEKKAIYLQIARLLTDRGGQNRMRYCNPQVDKEIVEAERAPERAVKVDLYGKIQKSVADELPQIYLWYPANVAVARARVGNLQLDASGSWYFIARLTLKDS